MLFVFKVSLFILFTTGFHVYTYQGNAFLYLHLAAENLQKT